MLFIIGGIVMAAAVSVLVIRGSKRKNRTDQAPAPTALTLRLPLLTNTQTFYAPTVVADNRLLMPLLTNEQTFYGFSVVRDPNNAIVFPLFTNSQTFYAPSIKQNITFGLLTNEQTFYGMQVQTSGRLTFPLLTNTQTFYAPSVNQNVSMSLLTNNQEFFGFSVKRDTTLLFSLHTNTQTFYQPAIKQNISFSKLNNVNGFFPFTISQPNNPGFALSTPTVTVTSSAGAALEATLHLNADHWAGYWVRIQRSTTGTKNVSDGSYASPTLNVRHFIVDSEVAALAITNADMALDDYIDPTGAGFQQYRIERDDGAISNWYEITYNVTASVATLNPATGINKSQYLTLSNGNLTGTGQNLGAPCGARATISASGKRHFELTVNALNASGFITVGVTNDTLALGPAQFPLPGNGTANGCCLRLSASGSDIFRNGSFQNGSGGGWVAGDVVIVEFDTAASSISFSRRRSGVTTAIGSTSISSNVPAVWHAYAGTYRDIDSFTLNFGASAFAVTPSTGYSQYG